MRVAVIGFNNMISMPYMRFYKKTLESYGVAADYYCWNREENGEIDNDGNIYTIKIKCPSDKFGKFFAMIKWRKLILKELNRVNYDKLIVLTSLPAFLLRNYLIKRYKNRYVFDIRDFTYENIDLYKKIIAKIIDNSYATFISSPGFRKIILTEKNVMQIHNIDVGLSDYGPPDLRKDIITIGYIGLISYAKSCILVMKNFAEAKYKLLFRGIYKNSVLQDYCKANGIKNVEFGGKFTSEEKNKIYEGIDIVNCIYCVNGETQVLKYALPNRLYDAIYCRRPIIALENNALADYIKKYGLGLLVSEKDDFSKKLDEYARGFNAIEFEKGAALCRKDIEQEQSMAIEKLLSFVGIENRKEKAKE